MTARMLEYPCRPVILVTGLVLAVLPGCHGLGQKLEAKKVPQYGTIDAGQPAELRKVTQPPYVIEPPDELEITSQPPVLTTASGLPYVVRADGYIDLGLPGEVYVYGLTLPEAEERIAAHLNETASAPDRASKEKYRVAVRLANSQSKFYYVLGTVATPGRVKSGGNETVLDAITQAGLKSNSVPQKAYLVRPHGLGGEDQVYKIDWFGIKDRGDTLTNYQIFPGDRVVVPGTKPPGLIKSLLGAN
jgi:polysaccharide export outer membrane protein